MRLALACTALALLALPAAGTAAKPHKQETELFVTGPEGPWATIGVAGTNGYRIEFSIAPADSSVVVTERDGAEAIYDVFNGTAAHGRFRARFGKLGIVSARFVPSRTVKSPPPSDCKGASTVHSSGTFVGTIRFQGEQGFTRFAGRRAHGEVRFLPQWICRDEKEPFVEGPPRHGARYAVTQFVAAGRAAGALTIFSARHSELEPEEVEFDATSIEDRGAVNITRNVSIEGPPTGFSFDPGANTATLSPPAPFSGSATFTRIDDFETRWFGPLAVSFPGRPNVPLTGRAYSWELTREELESNFLD